MGFEKFYLSSYHKKIDDLQNATKMKIVAVSKMDEVFSLLFG
jgi:hypothetical protein